MQQLGLGQWKLGQHAETLVGLNLCSWVMHNLLEEAEPSILPQLVGWSPKEVLGYHLPRIWIVGSGIQFSGGA